MATMNEMNERRLTISCDDCSMQCTSACDDCVVTFVMRDADEPDPGQLVLDLDQVRVVGLLSKAGLVPDLRYRAAS
jgi:hypothetical protein